MKFSNFVFSLCFGMTVSCSFKINKPLKIQIWHVPEDITQMTEILYDENFDLSSTETFIILEKTRENDIYHYSLFYWVGSQSDWTKRRNVAYKVVLLQDYLQTIRNGRLIFFGREMEGLESEKFCNLLDLGERPEKPILYRVEGSNGDLISLSPISGNTFRNTDTYVLQTRSKVIIWSAKNASTKKVNAARKLAKRILEVDLQKQDEDINQHITFIDDIYTERGFEIFNEYFSTNSSTDEPDLRKDKKIKKYINSLVDAYIFRLDKNCNVYISSISEDKKPLWLQLFNQNKAYLLKIMTARTLFIYLGKNAASLLIQRILSYVEDIVFADLIPFINITIVREGEALPTPFIIHFYDKILELLPASDKSRIDGSWNERATNAEVYQH